MPNHQRDPQNHVRRSQLQQTRANVHYQEILPPASCKVFLNIGIPNAYHWISDYPFRKQALSPYLLTEDTNARNQTSDQTGNNSPNNTNNSNI